ncbi:MAG: hypothetical protein ACI8RD_004846 [Bacillariaceae sp.]|jgi:hypothetical protein
MSILESIIYRTHNKVLVSLTTPMRMISTTKHLIKMLYFFETGRRRLKIDIFDDGDQDFVSSAAIDYSSCYV